MRCSYSEVVEVTWSLKQWHHGLSKISVKRPWIQRVIRAFQTLWNHLRIYQGTPNSPVTTIKTSNPPKINLKETASWWRQDKNSTNPSTQKAAQARPLKSNPIQKRRLVWGRTIIKSSGKRSRQTNRYQVWLIQLRGVWSQKSHLLPAIARKSRRSKIWEVQMSVIPSEVWSSMWFRNKLKTKIR